MEIQAVIFDMDGVLFDTEQLCLSCWDVAGEAFDLPGIREVAMGCIGLNREDSAKKFFAAYGERVSYPEASALMRRETEERIERDGLPLKPGVFELLDFIKGRGLKIGLSSSTRALTIRRHLERAGLTGYFEAITGGDQVSHGKPAPDIYLHTAAALGVKPQNALAVEDSYNGIRSAFAGGFYVVMVPDLLPPLPGIEGMLFAKKDSLFEVKQLLERLLP